MFNKLNPSTSGAPPSPQQLETAPEKITCPSLMMGNRITQSVWMVCHKKLNSGICKKAFLWPAVRFEPYYAQKLFERCMALHISGCSAAYMRR